MAGKSKKRIDYAGWSVDIFSNDIKIDKLLDAQSWTGFGVYFYLCQMAFGSEGYYYEWSYDLCATTARKMGGGVGAGTVKEAVDYCLQIGLFDKRLFDRWGVLTSRGIQKSYLAVLKGNSRRRTEIYKEYWLLDISNEENCQGVVFVHKNVNSQGANINSQGANCDSIVWNGTEWNGMVLDGIEQDICAEPEPSHAPPVISLTLNDKSLHDVYQSDIDAWAELYPAVDILQELRKMKGWLDSNPTKRKTKRGIGRFINSWLARTHDSGGSRTQPTQERHPDKQEKLQNLLRSIREDEENEHNRR